MNKLAQFANGAVYDEDMNVHEVHNDKLDKLAEIVEAANGNSVLVFYQYKHDIPRIVKKLKGYKVVECRADRRTIGPPCINSVWPQYAAGRALHRVVWGRLESGALPTGQCQIAPSRPDTPSYRVQTDLS